MSRLALRPLWSIYKETLIEHGVRHKRDFRLAHVSFYEGAYTVVRLLDHMIKQGNLDQVHKTIQDHARHLDAMYGEAPQGPRTKHH